MLMSERYFASLLFCDLQTNEMNDAVNAKQKLPFSVIFRRTNVIVRIDSIY